MKKFLMILFTVLLTESIFIAQAYGSDKTYSEGYFYYTVADESVTITGYFGHEKTVRVPERIAGYPVNAIADGAFKDTGIETLYLPDTIMYVGEGSAGAATVMFADGNQKETMSEVVPVDSGTSDVGAESDTAGGKESEPVPDDSSERKFDELTVDDEAEDAGDNNQEPNNEIHDEVIDTSINNHDGVTIAKPGHSHAAIVGIAFALVMGLVTIHLLRKKQ